MPAYIMCTNLAKFICAVVQNDEELQCNVDLRKIGTTSEEI